MDLHLNNFKTGINDLIKNANELKQFADKFEESKNESLTFSSRNISQKVTDMVVAMNLDIESYAGFVVTKVDGKTYKLYFTGIKKYSDFPKFINNEISGTIQKTYPGVDMYVCYLLEDTHIFADTGETVIGGIDYHKERQRKLRIDYKNGDVKSLALYSSGADRMKTERLKQIWKYGYSVQEMEENPQYYDQGQLKSAAVKLLSVSENNTPEMIIEPINWNGYWFYKMLCEPYEERVLIAGALLASELDRLEYIKK